MIMIILMKEGYKLHAKVKFLGNIPVAEMGLTPDSDRERPLPFTSFFYIKKKKKWCCEPEKFRMQQIVRTKLFASPNALLAYRRLKFDLIFRPNAFDNMFANPQSKPNSTM